MVIDENGAPITATPLSDTFLGEWTPDGEHLVCFRDWEYALVSKEGRVVAGRIPNDPNKRPATEWRSFGADLSTTIKERLKRPTAPS